ncbi:MAG: amidohydrolase family protein [Ilumatobacteraceae bacterium]
MSSIGIISVDDHLVEPPDLWTSRLPRKMVERGPRVVSIEGGADAWAFEDRVEPIWGNAAASGRDRTPALTKTRYSDMLDGYFDPVARLAAMDEGDVLASLVFPYAPGFSGTMFSKAQDLELGLACIQAYNDFMLDEWCAAAPGRYIPMVIIPLWDAALAVDEIHRTAAKGSKAIAFSEDPYHQGFPSLHDADGYWDPVLAAAQETGMPLCMHMGSSSTVVGHRPDRPLVTQLTMTHFNSIFSFVDWLMSGHFARFPGLKVCFSEGGIGWMPHVIEDCDRNWRISAQWTESKLTEPPSTYMRDHVFGCFIDDPHGARSIREIGIDNVMAEVDYPHADSTWPHSEKIFREQLAHLDEAELTKVLRGNAERVFNFTPSGFGQR